MMKANRTNDNIFISDAPSNFNDYQSFGQVRANSIIQSSPDDFYSARSLQQQQPSNNPNQVSFNLGSGMRDSKLNLVQPKPKQKQDKTQTYLISPQNQKKQKSVIRNNQGGTIEQIYNPVNVQPIQNNSKRTNNNRTGYQIKSPKNRPIQKKVISMKSRKLNQETKLHRSIDEEEKVPSEHPPKRHSIGLNFYQTNYFTQNIENQNCFKQYEVSDEESKGNDLQQLMRKDSFSLKRKNRMPTSMPYNLPGDDLDNIDKEGRQEYPQQIEPKLLPIDSTGNMSLFNLNPIEIPPNSQPFAIFGQQQQFLGKNQGNQILFQQELMKEIEQLRKEVQNKDRKMQKMNVEMQKLRKDNHSLQMKLQFETRNNTVLLKNINRMRSNYFNVQATNQPNIRQQTENHIQRNLQNQNSPMIRRQNNQQQRQQRNVINNNLSLMGNGSVASESNQSGSGVVDNHTTQQVHSFQPPTRASQGLRHQQLMNQIRGINSQIIIHNNQRIPRYIRNQMTNPNGEQEDASLYDTQYNEESIYINKVNEMQIKTSRFDQPQPLLRHGYHARNRVSEDYIPNEEPLINVREFWGSNINHNYRMRWPRHLLLDQQFRMQNLNSFQNNQGFFINQYQHYHQHMNHMYGAPNREQQQRQGVQRGQGNIHNVFNNNRRYDLDNNPSMSDGRFRVNSQGPPLKNIHGDLHNCQEEEEGLIIGGGQQVPRQPSEDSVEDLEEEEKHHALPHNHQIFLQNYSFSNPHRDPLVGFSVDDGGMDEYDVADERQHLFEYINPDNMTYEELIALQERIGYVSKGLTRDKINRFPKMRKKDLQSYFDKKKNSQPRKLKSSSLSLLDLEIKNPLEESKHSNKRNNFRNIGGMNEEESEEIADGDEGFMNRKLPINCYNNQQVNEPSFGSPFMEEEEGWENCKEEDEERKDIELIDKSLKRRVSKDKQLFELQEEELQKSQLISQSSTNKERCAICFDGIRSQDYIKLLPCSHYYHNDCIDQWLMVEKRCPMCMSYLDHENN